MSISVCYFFYFLSYFYVQEVFEDINKSLNLWVGIQSGDIIPLENVIPLLLSVIDLVSIKVKFVILSY